MGVTPPPRDDDDHTGATAKQPAGPRLAPVVPLKFLPPSLFLSSLLLLLLAGSQPHCNHTAALMEQYRIDGGAGDFPPYLPLSSRLPGCVALLFDDTEPFVEMELGSVMRQSLDSSATHGDALSQRDESI